MTIPRDDTISVKATIKLIQKRLNLSREAAIRQLETMIRDGRVDPIGCPVAIPEWDKRRGYIDRRTLVWTVPVHHAGQA